MEIGKSVAEVFGLGLDQVNALLPHALQLLLADAHVIGECLEIITLVDSGVLEGAELGAELAVEDVAVAVELLEVLLVEVFLGEPARKRLLGALGCLASDPGLGRGLAQFA